MKTTPTETDREAAQLFKPAQGMRVRVEERPGAEVWATVCDECTVFLEWTRYSSAEANVRTLGQVMAIDTDDPASTGCMVAQVEETAGAPGELWHCPDDPPDAAHVAFVRDPSFESFCAPTRGAALVAAMKALKGAPSKTLNPSRRTSRSWTPSAGGLLANGSGACRYRTRKWSCATSACRSCRGA